MVVKMTGIIINICRLCLKIIQDLECNKVISDLDVINDSERDIIQIVLPQIDLHYSDNPMICKSCVKLLEQSFAFKSKCLEIEDSIHDYKRDGDHRVNLEKILGIKEDDSVKCIKICRTCLGYLDNNAFAELDQENTLKCILGKCLPELDIELTLNPVICQFCEEVLKEIDNFVTLCIGNEEKIRFYFEQRDDITLEDIAQYELNKDNLPSTKSSLGCSKNFQLHNVFSSSNVDKGNEEVYIISDNENDRDGTAERSSSRYNITKRLKSGRAVADAEATSDDDFDWNSDSYDYVDTSDEEAYPRPCKKPKVAEKRKQLKVIPLKKSVFCKYCYHIMVSELAARKHISSCPRNPFLQQSMKKTALVKKKLLATMLSNNALSPVSDESVPEARNETVELSEKEDSVKEDVKVTNGAKMAEEELSAVKQNIGIAETILMKGITEVINDVEETAEKNCGESASDDCVIVETKPVDDPLMVEVEIVPAATNGNLKMMEREILDNESKLEDIQSAIEKNNKEIFSELTVLVCNRCVFNSRSTLKMAVHCASHLVTSEKTVDYVSGYRTVYYCVNCVKAFRTAGFLRCHVDRCPRVDEKVFLLKIGKVMHCTKCYFDSDDTKIVLQHLLNCGNIKIGNAER